MLLVHYVGLFLWDLTECLGSGLIVLSWVGLVGRWIL
jgi:hypothetical protein